MPKNRGSYGLFILVLTVLAIVAAGCAKPPVEEMLRAEKATEDARQKGADVYAPDIYKKMGASFQKAKDLVSAKKYEEAKKEAKETVQLAGQAVAVSDFNKTKMGADAEQLMQGIQAKIDELKALPAESFKKKAAAKHELLQELIGKWEADLSGIRDKLREGQFLQANAELRLLQEEVDTQKRDITASLKPVKK